MSGRDWVFVCTLGGCLILAGGGEVHFLQAQETPSEAEGGSLQAPTDAATGSEASDHQPPKDTGPSPDAPRPAVNNVEPATSEPVAGEPEQDGDSEAKELARADLRAQQAMASATDQMAVAAWLSTAFAFAGLLLLWRTMLYTKRAAEFAGNAVEEAERATAAAHETVKAAVAANTIAQNTARRQLRAYMVPASGTLTRLENGAGFILSVAVRNCGATPALNVRSMGETFAAPYPLQEDRPHPVPGDGHSVTIGGGCEMTCAFRLFTESPELALAAVERGEMGFWIQGTVTYEDIFGEPHATQFRWVMGGRLTGSGGVMMHADMEGNSAD